MKTANVLEHPRATEPVKRLNANLLESELDRFKRLAQIYGVSVTTLIRDGLGLLEYFTDALSNGNRIVIMNPKGEVAKEVELLLPRYHRQG